jgi:hypothetical protein
MVEMPAKAKTKGMTLCLEVLNRNEGYIDNTLGDAREVILAI